MFDARIRNRRDLAAVWDVPFRHGATLRIDPRKPLILSLASLFHPQLRQASVSPEAFSNNLKFKLDYIYIGFRIMDFCLLVISEERNRIDIGKRL